MEIDPAEGLVPQAAPDGWYHYGAPTGWPLTGQERLRLTTVGAVGSLTIVASVRTLTQRGNVQRQVFTAPVSSTRAIQTAEFEIGDGTFLDVTIRASAGTPLEGQCWVAADFIIGQAGEKQKLVTIGYGYVTASKPVFLPYGQNTGPLEGAGVVRSIVGTTPGAGVNVTETVPAGARWELIGFRYQLVTSAVVANRISSLVIDDGVNPEVWACGNTVTQAASGTDVYHYGQGQPASNGSSNTLSAALPIGNRLLAGWRIRTSTVALDAGDQYSAVGYFVREWLDF